MSNDNNKMNGISSNDNIVAIATFIALAFFFYLSNATQFDTNVLSSQLDPLRSN